MPLPRMDNVLIVVDDLEAAKAFFAEIGLEVEGETTVEGPWVGQTIGLDDVRADITMMRTPDGDRVELTRYHRPAAVKTQPQKAPSNALGIRRIMFTVEDVDDLVARLRDRHGAELVGEITQFEDVYRLCFIRAPEGFIVGLAEELG